MVHFGMERLRSVAVASSVSFVTGRWPTFSSCSVIPNGIRRLPSFRLIRPFRPGSLFKTEKKKKKEKRKKKGKKREGKKERKKDGRKMRKRNTFENSYFLIIKWHFNAFW